MKRLLLFLLSAALSYGATTDIVIPQRDSSTTFTNRTITGSSHTGTLLFINSSGTLTYSPLSMSDTGAISFPDGVKQTFNPSTSFAGFNVGAVAGNPASLANGDMWYNSDTDTFYARIAGASVALGAGGSGTGAFEDLTGAPTDNTALAADLAAKQSRGLVRVSHQSGAADTVYTPSADTDTARGTILRTAVAAATTAGDHVIAGAATYALGDNNLVLTSNTHLTLSPGALVTSTCDLFVTGCIINPGNNSIITGYGAEVRNIAAGGSGYQGCVGVVLDNGEAARTGFQVLGLKMTGSDTDAFYIQHTTVCSATLRDCTMTAKWDACILSADGSTPTVHAVDAYNCTVIVTGPSGGSRGYCACDSAVLRVFGGKVTVTSGGASGNDGAQALRSGVVELHKVSTTVSNGGSAKYDVNNVSGTIKVSDCTGSDTNGGLFTSGTITRIGDNYARAVSSYQPLDSDLTSFALITRASGVDTFIGAPSSANLAAMLTDETGTGASVLGTSPTITTSLVAGSSTFALLNTTATTINAFGAATGLNIAATATGIGVASSSTTNLALPASTTGVSSLRIAHGAAPTSPVNGDVWTTTAGLYARINGSTVGPLANGSGDVTAASSFGTDNRLVRSDGTGKGVQSTGITVDDSDNVTGVTAITAATVNVTALAGTSTLAGNPALSASGLTIGTTGIIFEGATADTSEGLLLSADVTGDRTWTLPDADTKIPVSAQTLTFTGPTAARTITLPDAAFTVARTDAANTFTGTQTVGALVATTVNGNTVTSGSGTLTLGASKTLTVSETVTLNRQSSTGIPCEFCVAASDETTAITTGTGKVTFRAPYAFTLTELRASVNTAPTGSTILIDVNESGTTVISTKIMIDASEKTSQTAATPYVISDSAIADDAEISVDFDQVGSSVAGAGVKVWIKGYR